MKSHIIPPCAQLYMVPSSMCMQYHTALHVCISMQFCHMCAAPHSSIMYEVPRDSFMCACGSTTLSSVQLYAVLSEMSPECQHPDPWSGLDSAPPRKGEIGALSQLWRCPHLSAVEAPGPAWLGHQHPAHQQERLGPESGAAGTPVLCAMWIRVFYLSPKALMLGHGVSR